MEKTPDVLSGLRGLLVPLVAYVSKRHRRLGRDMGITVAQALTREPVVYEVFGLVRTVADISYFDVNSAPRRVVWARLPWSIQLMTNSPAVVSNVVGDTNSIGCRIVVDGHVKAERISNEVNAFTHCRVKGA